MACFLDVHGGQKVALDPLELELQRIMSHHVGALTQIWVLVRASVLNCSTFSPSPRKRVLIKNFLRLACGNIYGQLS